MSKIEWKEIDGVKYYKFNKRKDELKHLYGNLIALALVVLLIPTLLFFCYYVFVETHECLRNPFTFGLDQMVQSGGSSPECSCTIIDENGEFVNFKMNQTSLWVPRLEAMNGGLSYLDLESLNFSVQEAGR